MVTFHNYMVLNPGKCYNMTFTSNTNKNEFVFENCIGDNNRLPFKPYLKQLRKKNCKQTKYSNNNCSIS